VARAGSAGGDGPHWGWKRDSLGPTTLSNLALLCRRHHWAVHEGAFQLEREDDGVPLPDVPAPVPVPADPVQVLRAAHVDLGIHAQTTRPSWLGSD
jgi:hypothetical protein